MSETLKQLFPNIRTEEAIIGEIKSDENLLAEYESWTELQQRDFLKFCSGISGRRPGICCKTGRLSCIFSDSRKSCQKGEAKTAKRLYDDRSGRRTDAPGYQSDLLHRKPAPQHSVPYRKRGFSHCRSNEKGGSAFKRQRIFQMP